MKLNKETIDKIAVLSRLEVSEQEAEGLLKDMNNILQFMEQLNELDTTGVNPLIYLSEEQNVTRADEVKKDITVQEAIANAPNTDGSYFRVAKVISK